MEQQDKSYQRPVEPVSSDVREALQGQTIASLQGSLSELSQQVSDGFKGVHTRQDTTNGRISAGEREVALLKLQIENDKALAKTREEAQEERGQNRIRVWQVVSLFGPIIVGLASYIIYNN